jgi:hypothetical protein
MEFSTSKKDDFWDKKGISQLLKRKQETNNSVIRIKPSKS